MAGLGEACTHIAAVLFYLEALARIQGSETCTQLACRWIIPSYMKSIDYCPTKKINFTSARGRKRKLDELIDGEGTRMQECDMPLVPHGDVATDTDMAMLFENLSLGGTRPAVFSVLPDYSDPFVPKIMLPYFPKPLIYRPGVTKVHHSSEHNSNSFWEPHIVSHVCIYYLSIMCIDLIS